MRWVELQIAPWEKNLMAECPWDDLAMFDDVIAQTEQGRELARVIGLLEEKPAVLSAELARRVSDEDYEHLMSAVDKSRALQACHDLIKKFDLNMKLVDVRSDYDNGRLTFAFVANGRVDFRELVKELTHRFSKNIRLQQIGIRDEAKAVGDQGRCGLGLCCRTHLTKFTSVGSDVAEAQDLIGRGSDRLSGACGRLMCCLAYEAEGYKELAAKLPELGSEITVDGQRGVVIGQNVLKSSLDVRFRGVKDEADYVAEVPWSG